MFPPKEIHEVVRKSCMRFLRNLDWRRDAEQDALLKLWRVYQKGENITELLAYVVTRNACYDMLRRREKDSTGFLVKQDEVVFPDVILSLDLESWILIQPPATANVLHLVLHGGPWETTQELASKCNVSKATVSRVFMKLHEFLINYQST